jgi:hypothetical protein
VVPCVIIGPVSTALEESKLACQILEQVGTKEFLADKYQPAAPSKTAILMTIPVLKL